MAQQVFSMLAPGLPESTPPAVAPAHLLLRYPPTTELTLARADHYHPSPSPSLSVEITSIKTGHTVSRAASLSDNPGEVPDNQIKLELTTELSLDSHNNIGNNFNKKIRIICQVILLGGS